MTETVIIAGARTPMGSCWEDCPRKRLLSLVPSRSVERFSAGKSALTLWTTSLWAR